MKIVITGGAGFLGQRLARQLLSASTGRGPTEQIVLIDRMVGSDLADDRAVYAIGDVGDRAFLQAHLCDAGIIYHLAAVVSSQAEADFDLGLAVNIDALRLLLEVCREAGHRPRVVFTSSVAVLGPHGDAVVDDETPVDPRSSYGMGKAVGELLVAEYSRRGFIDGFTLRLPTISVRPGLPNQAASSFASSIIREPLCGQRAQCPVSHQTALWLLSPRRAVTALAHAATLDSGALHARRTINLPGLSVTVREMLDALEWAGGAQARALVDDAPDQTVERIVASWPARWDQETAKALGFRGDVSINEIISAFVEDDLAAQRSRLCAET